MRLCDVQARLAITRAPFIRHERVWKYGRRTFNNETVKRLRDSGAAKQIGNKVVKA